MSAAPGSQASPARAHAPAHARPFSPALLGFGLFLAWASCMPWAKGHVIGFDGPSNLNVLLHAGFLVALAFLVNYRRLRLASVPFVAGAGALATAVPALSFAARAAAAASPSAPAALALTVLEGVAEGTALAAFYLLWHEQYARRPQRAAWPGYAASFLMAPLAYFAVTPLSGPVALVVILALPLASCILLHRCMRSEWFAIGASDEAGRAGARGVRGVPPCPGPAAPAEPDTEDALGSPDTVGALPWRFPWRPALLMAAFSFTYYMLLHLFGGMSTMGQLGNLAVAGVLLLACTALFDAFDPRTLYKACPVLMVCALLSLTQELQPLSEAGDFLASTGFTGFTLFICFILNSICFRYGVPAAWLFGIVLGCSGLAHAAGSAAGRALADAAVTDPQLVSIALDAAVVALVLLSLALLSERDFSTTWGIRPAGKAAETASRATARGAGGRAGAGVAHTPSGGVSGPEGPAQPADTADTSRVPSAAPGVPSTAGYYEEFVWRCSRVARHYGLTHREEEVLSLLAQGKSTQDIEAVLYISHNTAKGHLRHVYAKLGVHSREEAAALVASWR